MAVLDFIFDVNNPSKSSIIQSLFETATSSPNQQVRDDHALAMTIQPVTVNPTGSWSLYSPDWINTDTFQWALGLADGTATSGTFNLTVGATTTGLTGLAYNITAAALQTPLSAAFVTEGKPGCTVTQLEPGSFRVRGVSAGAIPANFITDDASLLNPACDIVVLVDTLGSVSVPYNLLLIIRLAPLAYATPSTALGATGVSVATTQAGNTTANQIQTVSFTVPNTHDGTFSVSLVAAKQIPFGDNTVANPTAINTFTPHGLISGQTVNIPVNNGSSPTIAGNQVVTVVNSTSFSIPVNVTAAGANGLFSLSVTETCGVAWPQMTEAQFSQLLAVHKAVDYQNTDGSPNNILVTKSGQAFVVNFIGTLGNSAIPALTVTNIDLIGPQGVSGSVNLNTISLYEYSLTQDGETFDALLTITRTRVTGEVRTIFGPATITIAKDLIDVFTLVPVAFPAWTQNQALTYLVNSGPALGITTVTATDATGLAGQPTAGLGMLGRMVWVDDATYGYHQWELCTGTNASAPGSGYQRPADYNNPANEVVWIMRL